MTAATVVMARPRLPAWLMGLVLVLMTMAIYWPAMRGAFVSFDDPVYITANPRVQHGLTLENIRWACWNPVCCNWHPLTVWSHMLDCQLFGLNPWGHHLTSVLMHALNAGLVFALLQLMTGAAWRSLLVAAFFAVHPLRVESVAWVSERKDVLSAFFGLLALIAYARYARCRSPKSEVRSPKVEGGGQRTENRGQKSVVSGQWSLFPLPSSISYLLCLAFFALGLMSKPVLVTWPFVMLLLDYWPLQRLQLSNQHSKLRTLFPLLLEKLPFFVLAALGSVVTFLVQQRVGALAAGEYFPLGARVGNALISYARYLRNVLWPADLAIFYPHPGQWPPGKVLLAGGLILGLSVLVWAGRRRAPFLLMGWLWYCGTLVPVSQVVQTGGHGMADRYTYLPSIGLLMLMILGAHELTRGWRYRVLALAVAGNAAIVLCLALTWQQIAFWKDSEVLFRHAAAVTENNYLAHYNLGVALDDKGQTDKAIGHYQEALRLKPAYADIYYNLGLAFGKKGQLDEAISQLQEAIRLNPDHFQAHNNLGVAFGMKGQTDKAIHQYQEAIRLNPDCADAHYNLGVILGRNGRLDEAISQFVETIRLSPDHFQAHNNLGSVLYQRGGTGEAIRQFQEALRLKPDYAEARRNLDAVLATKANSPPPGP
jgi:protein O-mannosyl-transferase